MPTLHLIIPEPLLRIAVLEQLTAYGMASLGERSDMGAALADEAATILLLDEDGADKKNMKLLRDGLAAGKKKSVFLLGSLKNEADEELITESFAKPLRLGHLIARVQFYLQAVKHFNSTSIIFGPYRLETQSRQVVTESNGAIIRLTEKETALLDYLGQNTKAVTREELLASIWGYDAQIDTHTLETHIYQLRRKLDPEGAGTNWLINEQGAYRLNRQGAV